MRGLALYKLFFVPVFLMFVVFSGSSRAQAVTDDSKMCLDPQPKPNDFASNKGIDFLPWENMVPEQRNLLEGFFGPGLGSIDFTQLSIKEDGKAAAFLAITTALTRLTFSPGTPQEMSGLDLVKGIKEIRADRLIAYLDVEKIKSWMHSEMKYSIALTSKGQETGNLTFYDHTTASAALHCGYDLQWYTKALKAPHLHWNVRFSDGQADVHLDGYVPWIGGVIPNPIHLTYANSDVRFWFPEYLKKYGDPGFKITKR